VAFVAPWGFDVTQLDGPVLVVQGGQDRVVPPAHADWLVRNCRSAELWLRPHDGHVSVLDASPVAMDWLRGCSLSAAARASGRESGDSRPSGGTG
jgi:pimeloyl-ACP methyl ester carboxylesterase